MVRVKLRMQRVSLSKVWSMSSKAFYKLVRRATSKTWTRTLNLIINNFLVNIWNVYKHTNWLIVSFSTVILFLWTVITSACLTSLENSPTLKCWQIKLLNKSVLSFTNIQVFNNFADFIFISVIKTKNCVKLSLFNINNADASS